MAEVLVAVMVLVVVVANIPSCNITALLLRLLLLLGVVLLVASRFEVTVMVAAVRVVLQGIFIKLMVLALVSIVLRLGVGIAQERLRFY